jgi:ribonuclease PH
VALALALEPLRRRKVLEVMPVKDLLAAVSVGLVDGRLLLDLDYEEDSQAQVDANFVVTGKGELVEVQATGEGHTFPAPLLTDMVALALQGARTLNRLQEEALKPWLPLPW